MQRSKSLLLETAPHIKLEDAANPRADRRGKSVDLLRVSAAVNVEEASERRTSPPTPPPPPLKSQPVGKASLQNSIAFTLSTVWPTVIAPSRPTLVVRPTIGSDLDDAKHNAQDSAAAEAEAAARTELQGLGHEVAPPSGRHLMDPQQEPAQPPVRCSVCFESSSAETVDGWYTCKGCNESVCYGCLRSVLLVSTSESKKLECVQFGCFKKIHKKLAIELVGKERVRKHHKHRKMKKDLDLRECPHCLKLQQGNAMQPNMTCVNCKGEFCYFHDLQHAGKKCSKSLQNSGGLLSNLYLSTTTTKCPSCKVRVQRTGGCPHMTCSRCNKDFCYYCGGDWSGSHRRTWSMKCHSARAWSKRIGIATAAPLGAALFLAGGALAFATAPIWLPVRTTYKWQKQHRRASERARRDAFIVRGSPSPNLDAHLALQGQADRVLELRPLELGLNAPVSPSAAADVLSDAVSAANMTPGLEAGNPRRARRAQSCPTLYHAPTGTGSAAALYTDIPGEQTVAIEEPQVRVSSLSEETRRPRSKSLSCSRRSAGPAELDGEASHCERLDLVHQRGWYEYDNELLSEELLSELSDDEASFNAIDDDADDADDDTDADADDDADDEAAGSRWSCAVCTLDNDMDAEHCDACETPRPAHAASHAASRASSPSSSTIGSESDLDDAEHDAQDSEGRVDAQLASLPSLASLASSAATSPTIASSSALRAAMQNRLRPATSESDSSNLDSDADNRDDEDHDAVAAGGSKLQPTNHDQQPWRCGMAMWKEAKARQEKARQEAA